MHGPPLPLGPPRSLDTPAEAAPGHDKSGWGESGGVVALLRALWRRRGIFLAVVAAVLALAVLTIRLLPARYEATAALMLQPRLQEVREDSAGRAAPDGDAVMLASEIEVITSRGLLAQVVTEHGLLTDPAFNPARTGEPSPWVRLGLAKPTPPLGAARQRERVVEALRGRMTVRPRGRARVIALTVEAGAARKAARLANAVAERYVARRVAAERAAKNAAAAELRAAVTRLRTSLDATEAKLAAQRRRAGLAGPDTESLAAGQVAALADKLRAARERHDEAQARLAQAERLLTADALDAAGDVLTSPEIRDLNAELTALRREHAKLSRIYGQRHPELRASAAALEAQRRELRGAMNRIVANLRHEAEIAARRVDRLAARLAQRRTEAANSQRAARRLNALNREAEAERQVFEAQLARLTRAQAAPAQRRPDVRVLSRAVPPAGPSAPNTPLLLALAFMTALPCGAVAALLRDQFDKGLNSRADGAAATDLPVLAAIPELIRTPGRSDPADQVAAAPRAAFAEALHKLAGAVLLHARHGPLRTVLVTSADTGEGKSTLALGLARVLAARGERVLLIEGDLRRPGLARRLAMARGPGLAELLDPARTPDAALWTAAIRLDRRSDLHVLPAGGPVARPAERLASARLDPFFRALDAAYDRVIVDAPPSLLVSDALTLARQADTTLVALRWGRTSADAARWAVEELRRADVDLAGAVLTRVDTRRQKDHAAGDAVPYGPKARAYYH